MAGQCKQSGVLCYIGLVKDHGGHLVNQPCLSLFEKGWKTTVGDQIGTIRKTCKCRTRWRKCADENTCVFTQLCGSNL